jgi:hypothetical protein
MAIHFEEYSYTIAAHFVCAIEYGDLTVLDDDGEEQALAAFMDRLPGPGYWTWGDTASFARDDVAGLWGQCVDAVYLVPEGVPV